MDNKAKNEMLVESYYKNNSFKLHKTVDGILKKFGGITNFDREECYGIASVVLANLWKTDVDSDKFKGLFHFALTNKIKSYVTYKNRDRRCYKEKDDDGDITYIYPVSLDSPIETGGSGDKVVTYADIIQSSFNMDEEIENEMGVTYGKNIDTYLKSLSEIQRRIATMIMEGRSPGEIKADLKITDKEYQTAMLVMKSYDKSKLLKRECVECEYMMKEDMITMEQKSMTTSERKKDTSYAISSLMKMLSKKRLRDDHVLQRSSGQHNNFIKSELMSDILQGNSLTQIIISEEPRGNYTLYWLIDGKNRCADIAEFMNDGFAISKNVQVYEIPYQVDRVDGDGELVCTEEGFGEYDIATFDIRGKKFSQLPEELQDKFRDYQIPVLMNLNCNKKMIAYDIARFNRCRPMNVAQNGWTEMDYDFGEMIDKILKMEFFSPSCKKSNYTVRNETNGALRRMIVESIMVSHFMDDYTRDFDKMCRYISENANDAMFVDFYDMIEKLSAVSNENVAKMFTIKDSFLWFSLFYNFQSFEIDDKRFIDFMEEFDRTLHSKKIGDITYDDIESKSTSTKQKKVIAQKLKHLELLMRDYLGVISFDISDSDNSEINVESNNAEVKEETESTPEKTDTYDTASVLEFVRHCVDSNITAEDIKDYEEDMEVLTLDCDSKSPALNPKNHNSLIAIIAYSYLKDIRIDEWFVEYINKGTGYEADQERNYLHMRNNLLSYLKKQNVA